MSKTRNEAATLGQDPWPAGAGQAAAIPAQSLGQHAELVVFAIVFADLTAGCGRGALHGKRHGFAPSWGPGGRLWGRRPEGSLMEQNQVDAKDFFSRVKNALSEGHAQKYVGHQLRYS
jgi:hypothetical protein